MFFCIPERNKRHAKQHYFVFSLESTIALSRQEAAHIARRLGRSLSMMMMELGAPPELVEEYTTRFLRGRRPE
jgi:hypothetical protein